MTDTPIPDIGKYKIIELVGEGAMGVVYRAVDSVLDRTVAIKVMNESIARQADLRKRFLNEAQAAASLQHPNVVCIYDLGEVDGHLFIAMEFVYGVDLEKLLELQEPLSLQARLDIVIDVLTGLSFAHKRGIIHRDIKPANIRITDDGRAKIMDFGVAHLASSTLTSTGAILGTPSYMAPEQITEGKTSPATDLFAVGGILYQLLTQIRPFEGQTLQNLFFKIITEQPTPISELKPGLPPALERIVDKAMAKDPSHRYTNALEMANELSAVRSKLSGASYPESVSLSASVSSAIEQARTTKTRSRNFAFAGAGAVFAIAALLGWSQLSKPRPTSGLTASAPSTRVDVVALPAPIASPPATTAAVPPPAVVNPEPPAVKEDVAAQRAEARRVAALQTKLAQQRAAAAARNAATRPAPPPSRVAQPPATSSAPALTTQAPVQNPIVQQQVVTTPPPAAALTRPVETPPRETQPTAPAAPTSADVSPTIQAYARAIESRDVGAIKRVYPDLTANQERGFEQFFRSARSVNVTFRVTSVEGTGSTAVAHLAGAYDYVNAGGQSVHQPVGFAATLRNTGGGWRLVAVR
jgi:serine/threonine-protein kinase